MCPLSHRSLAPSVPASSPRTSSTPPKHVGTSSGKPPTPGPSPNQPPSPLISLLTSPALSAIYDISLSLGQEPPPRPVEDAFDGRSLAEVRVFF